jgi:hypothetical protein
VVSLVDGEKPVKVKGLRPIAAVRLDLTRRAIPRTARKTTSAGARRNIRDDLRLDLRARLGRVQIVA